MDLEYRLLGTGKPMVILHGIFGSGDNWLTVSKQLAEHYQLYLVDQRNHGRSFHADDFTYTDLVADLLRFLDTHNLDKVILLGHSMGGKVVMNFATQYPERVEALIVVDIAPKAYPIHHAGILQGLQSIDLAALTSRNQADQQLASFVPEADTRAFLLKNLYRAENGGYGWRLNLTSIAANIGNVGAVLPTEARADVPTLFVKGANSRYILPEDEAEIQRHFPQADLAVVENAGHWVQAEQPAAFIDVVLNFLQKAGV